MPLRPLVAALLFSAAGLWAKSDLPQALDDKLIEGIRLVHADRYEEAFAQFEAVQLAAPAHPAGYFFQGAALEWIALDYRNYDQGPRFFALMTKAVALAQAQVNKTPADPWALFYLGGAYGFMGLTHIKYGNWLKAFFDGMTGYKHMMKALELKPDLYDVYFGLGQFHYWRSKKSAVIHLLTARDELKQGIDELLLAVKKGYFTIHETKNALVTIYREEKDIPKSMALLADTMAVFPEYLFSYWVLSKNLMDLGSWREALKSLDMVERKVSASPWSGTLAYLECYVLKATCLERLGEREQARAYLDKARALDTKKVKSIALYGELQRKADALAKTLGAP